MESKCEVWTDKSFPARETEHSGRTPMEESSAPVSFEDAANPSRKAWTPQADRLDQPEGDSLIIVPVPPHSRELGPRQSTRQVKNQRPPLVGGGLRMLLAGALLSSGIVLSSQKNRNDLCVLTEPTCEVVPDLLEEALFQAEETLHRFIAQL